VNLPLCDLLNSVNHIGVCDVAVVSVMWHLSESPLM
jgi:hypothetical protein